MTDDPRARFTVEDGTGLGASLIYTDHQGIRHVIENNCRYDFADAVARAANRARDRLEFPLIFPSVGS